MSMYEGGPAFPRPASEYTKNGTLPDGNDAITAQDGMTLRDWFAGQALIMAGTYRVTDDEEARESTAAVIAKKAYGLADAMIAERSRKE